MAQSDHCIRITILADNQAGEGFVREHGFAAWIEAFGKRLLFDTGQGKALFPNAERCSIDLATADFLALSHGHYDHTGSVAPFLQVNAQCHAYAHRDVLNTRYSIHSATEIVDVSIPLSSKQALLELPDERLHWINRATELAPRIWSTGVIPRVHLLETTGGPFFLERSGVTPDLLHDDMALWIDTEEGLIIITGCCHAGLINTLQHVSLLSGEKKIRAVIGGFHLLHASQKRVETTIKALRAHRVGTVIPCHCTGEAAITSMQANLGERCQQGAAGLTWGFDGIR